MSDLRQRLKVRNRNLEEINNFLLKEGNPLVDGLLRVIEKYGGVDEINRRAQETRKFENLMGRLRVKNSPFVKDLEWLIEQRDKGAFISIRDYRKKVLGDKVGSMAFDESFAVTLEIVPATSSLGS